MWQCQRCNETIDKEFTVCWKCGTTSDGKPDPSFRSVESIEQEVTGRRKPVMTIAQRKTWLFLWAAGVVLLMVLVRSEGGVAAGLVSLLELAIGLASMGLVVAIVLVVVWVTLGALDRSDSNDDTSS